MGKVYYPRLAAPIATACSNMIAFGIQLVMFFCIWLYYLLQGSTSIQITPMILLVPVVILQMMLLSIGGGIIISSVTTKYRDLQVLLSFLVTLWMYATPIVYPLSQTGSKFFMGVPVHTFMCLNPVTPVIETFKYGFLGCGEFVGWRWLIYSFVFMCLLLSLGIVVFNKVQKSFMDTV